MTFDLINPSENILKTFHEKGLFEFSGKLNCRFNVVTLCDSIEIQTRERFYNKSTS